MNEKKYSNMFKFVLYQGDIILCEKMFDGDKFNPFTRYSIDIRDILPKIITKLQKVLSKKKYDVVIEVGRKDQTVLESENHSYDLYHHTQKIIDSYPQQIRNDLRYNPQSIIQQIENKTIKGVECKIGFYINENPIVERLFYVDGFNPVVRWSLDIVNTVSEISDSILDKIKKSDIKNMWDDYDLINGLGLSINQIRELSSHKREEMLRRVNRN
jgi:hypothetical protein